MKLKAFSLRDGDNNGFGNVTILADRLYGLNGLNGGMMKDFIMYDDKGDAVGLVIFGLTRIPSKHATNEKPF